MLRPPEWYRAVTASMLPPRLREAFGLSDADSGQSERARAWFRHIYPTLPARLRHVGPYQEAMARLSGRGSPDLPRGRSTGSGSDETGSLDEFITGRTRVFHRLWKISLDLPRAFTRAQLGRGPEADLWLSERWEVEARRPRIEAKGQLQDVGRQYACKRPLPPTATSTVAIWNGSSMSTPAVSFTQKAVTQSVG